MLSNTPAAKADEIINLLQSYGGSEYIGEPVTKLEHMIQSALLAKQQGLTDEVVIAAFLHDIGHICVEQSPDNDMAGMGVVDHEKIGADYLAEKDFSDRIVAIVANHVPAKRYLCWKFPNYYNKLSVASKTTLVLQGGSMSSAEGLAFEQQPFFKDIIAVRQIDEIAKEANIPIPDSLQEYHAMIITHLSR